MRKSLTHPDLGRVEKSHVYLSFNNDHRFSIVLRGIRRQFTSKGSSSYSSPIRFYSRCDPQYFSHHHPFYTVTEKLSLADHSWEALLSLASKATGISDIPVGIVLDFFSCIVQQFDECGTILCHTGDRDAQEEVRSLLFPIVV